MTPRNIIYVQKWWFQLDVLRRRLHEKQRTANILWQKYTFSIIETMLLEILLNAKVCWSSNFFFFKFSISLFQEH